MLAVAFSNWYIPLRCWASLVWWHRTDRRHWRHWGHRWHWCIFLVIKMTFKTLNKMAKIRREAINGLLYLIWYLDVFINILGHNLHLLNGLIAILNGHRTLSNSHQPWRVCLEFLLNLIIFRQSKLINVIHVQIALQFHLLLLSWLNFLNFHIGFYILLWTVISWIL